MKHVYRSSSKYVRKKSPPPSSQTAIDKQNGCINASKCHMRYKKIHVLNLEDF